MGLKKGFKLEDRLMDLVYKEARECYGAPKRDLRKKGPRGCFMNEILQLLDEAKAIARKQYATEILRFLLGIDTKKTTKVGGKRKAV